MARIIKLVRERWRYTFDDSPQKIDFEIDDEQVCVEVLRWVLSKVYLKNF